MALLAAVVSSCGGGNPAGPGTAPEVPIACAAFPDSRTAPYVLPYAAGRWFPVSRTLGHYFAPDGSIQAGGVQIHAIDVLMPIGTAVHATRAGVVVAVEERFSDDDHARLHENWVMIRHTDRTVARYIHLTRGGALVDVGDTVAQGQRVGLSGNSGESTAPHLHFDVQTCGPNLPPGYNNLPCGVTLPLSFRNTMPHVCGLQPGTAYRAEPFSPELR